MGIDIDKDGDEKYSIRPHDFEDFKILIDRWGTDYAEVGDAPEWNVDIEDLKFEDLERQAENG